MNAFEGGLAHGELKKRYDALVDRLQEICRLQTDAEVSRALRLLVEGLGNTNEYRIHNGAPDSGSCGEVVLDAGSEALGSIYVNTADSGEEEGRVRQ